MLLDALAYIHGNEVLHRDVKPGNIIVRDDAKPVLLDFGAALLGTPDTTHTLVGSPRYAPPEQFLPHGEIGPWSDLYALAHSFLAHIPETSLKRYPRVFVQALMRASCPRIAERYAQADAWLQDLHPRHSRRPWLLVVAGILALLTLISVLVYFYALPDVPEAPVAQSPEPENHAQLLKSAVSTFPAVRESFVPETLVKPSLMPGTAPPSLLYIPSAQKQKDDEPISPLAQKMKSAHDTIAEYDRILQQFDKKAREGWKTPEELEQALDEVQAAYKRRLEALRTLQQNSN